MEGEASRGVYILCQGRVKLLTTNSDGKSFILKIAQPGEVFGLNSILAGTPHEITAETLQPVPGGLCWARRFCAIYQGTWRCVFARGKALEPRLQFGL